MADDKYQLTLLELIAGLPEEERIVLTLHYVKSLTSSQIASVLGVPERAITTVIASGKARLRSSLPSDFPT